MSNIVLLPYDNRAGRPNLYSADCLAMHESKLTAGNAGEHGGCCCGCAVLPSLTTAQAAVGSNHPTALSASLYLHLSTRLWFLQPVAKTVDKPRATVLSVSIRPHWR